MEISIKGLYRVRPLEFSRLLPAYLGAFANYPKLMSYFKEEELRLAALEAAFQKYGRYDIRYGAAYSTDVTLKDFIILVESQEMRYSLPRYLAAGSLGPGYLRARKKLGPAGRAYFDALFDAVDNREAEVDLPHPHLYIDFLAVAPEKQGRGRGRRLIRAACSYADHRTLPCMLFTNTEEDVRFYQREGFSQVAELAFPEFGFTSWYMVRMPEECHNYDGAASE